MNTLIIDCSSGMNIYLKCGEKVFSHEDSNQKKHSDELLLVIDKLFDDAGITAKKIENVCVCVGPGSFTGIRVAVSIAKGLAVESNVKVFALSNFDIYSFENEKKYAIVLEGFSDFVYVRYFDGENSNDVCEHFADFVSKINGELSGYKIFVQNEKLQKMLIDTEISSKIAQKQTIFAFEEKISDSLSASLNQISPVYLRASQAEIERNEKLKKENK